MTQSPTRLREQTPELMAVVNNAGILATGEVEFGQTLEPFERQMDVNCLGTIRVTKAFSPLLRRCKTSPRLVNVTSLAARISLPGECSLESHNFPPFAISRYHHLRLSEFVRVLECANGWKRWKLRLSLFLLLFESSRQMSAPDWLLFKFK